MPASATDRHPADERVALSRAVLAALKGQSTAGTSDSTAELEADRASLEERADGGDVAAARSLTWLARLENVPRRVGRLLSLESAPVLLADGSQLPLDEAERLLAAKEEGRVHAALRQSLAEASAPFRHFHRHRSEAGAARTAAALGAPLTAIRDGALEALAALGGVAIDDAGALSRALDLPDPQGAFGDDMTKALVTLLRDATSRGQVVPPAAFRAPRGMAGAALEGRFAWPAGLRRAWRHHRTLDAVATATAWAHTPQLGTTAWSSWAARAALPPAQVSSTSSPSPPPSPPAGSAPAPPSSRAPAPPAPVRSSASLGTGPVPSPPPASVSTLPDDDVFAAARVSALGSAIGCAAALALVSAPVRRLAGAGRSNAERAARICAASFALRARAALALAPLAGDAHEDEAREAVIAAFGGLDPGRALLAELASPSWASVDDELPYAFMRAPAIALALRESFDETWAVRAEAWAAIEAGDIDLGASTDVSSAWHAWASEQL